jgi:hypothetical protein
MEVANAIRATNAPVQTGKHVAAECADKELCCPPDSTLNMNPIRGIMKIVAILALTWNLITWRH